MRSLHPVLKKWLSFIVVLALALSLAPGASALAPAKDLTDPEPTRTYNFYVDLNWKQTQVVKNGDTLVAPESPTTPEGWIFTGWVDRATGNPIAFGVQTVTPPPMSEEINADARIVPAYSITFIYNGNVIKTKIVPNDPADPANHMDDSDVFYTIQDGTQVFSHWSETPGGSTPYPVGTPTTKNTTLYLVTKPGSIVMFNSHGGSYVEPQYPNAGQPVVKPAPDPTRAGYTFSHWSATEGGPAYNFGTPVNNSMTLHAVWTPATANYKVLYYLENAEDDLYTLVESRNKSGPTEGSAVYNDATDFIDADPLPEENEAVERKRYVFDHSEPATIAGDGSTVFRVYFKRLTYAFRMCAADTPGVTIPGPECENSSYHLYASAQYKYGQSTAPTFDKGLHDPKLKDYIWKLYQNGSNMYSEAPLQKAENMWAWGLYSSGTIFTQHYREAAPGVEGNGPNQPPAGTIYNAIKESYVYSHAGMVYNTFIDGVIPTPGFTLYHLPSEATLLQQLYSGQLPDTGCNSGNGRIVCHWHQIQHNCHTVGTQKYCEGTIYYQRLSYKITFHRNITDAHAPVYNVPDIPYQQDISNTIANHAAALELTEKVESGKTYLFEGWYDNPAFVGTPYSFSGQTMPAHDLILYAKWILKPTRVNYCKAAGSTQCSYLTVPQNTQLNAPQQAQINSYKEPPTGTTEADFDGWYFRSSSGSYIKFDLANDYVGENTITLYPIYNLKDYGVTYSGGLGAGGVAPTDSKRYTSGTNAVVLDKGGLTPPTGQSFCGWRVDGDGSGRVYQPGETLLVDNNKNLTAQWCPGIPTTTVTYKPGAGNGAEINLPNQPINITHHAYGIGAGPGQADYTPKTGYVFESWKGANGTIYQPGDAVQLTLEGPGANNKNIFTAQWKRAVTDIVARKTWVGGALADHVYVELKLTRSVGGTQDPAFVSPSPTLVPAGTGTADTRTYTWTGLETHTADGKKYTYNVVETPVGSANSVVSPGATEYEFNVVNTLKSPQVDKEVTKIWKGGFYLDKPAIQVKLIGTCAGCATKEVGPRTINLADVTVTENPAAYETTWKFTWTGLDKIDVATGQEYSWHVQEEADPSPEWKSDCLSGQSMPADLTCVNEYKPPLIPPTNPENPDDPNPHPNPADDPGEVAGRKYWLGGKATGYADVTIRLRRKWPKNLSGDCGATPVYECEIGADIRDVNGAVVPSDVTLAKADAATHKWMHVWANLPKTDQKTGLDITYWIDELNVDALSPATLGKFVEVKDDNEDGVVDVGDDDLKVKNKYLPPLVPDDPGDPGDNPNPEPGTPGADGNVTGVKIWNGGADSDHVDIKLLLKRRWKKTDGTDCAATPADCGAEEEVTVTRDGAPVNPRVTLLKATQAAHQWKNKWTGLADRDFEYGYKYYYRIVEENTPAELAPYTQEAGDTDGNPVTVQNNYHAPSQSRVGTKVWVGGASYNGGVRPDVTLRLCRTLSSAPDFTSCNNIADGTTPQEQTLHHPTLMATWEGYPDKAANGIPYIYWIKETAAPADYVEVDRGDLGLLTPAQRMTVTNRFDSHNSVVQIAGEVKWHGGDPFAADPVLSKAKLMLFRGIGPVGPDGAPANPEKVVIPPAVQPAEVEVTRGAGDTGSHTFGNLPDYNPDGVEYIYYVDIVTGTGASAVVTQIIGDSDSDHFEKVAPPGFLNNQDYNYDLVVDVAYRAPSTTFRAKKVWEGGKYYNGGVRPDVWFKIQRHVKGTGDPWEDVPVLPPPGNTEANARIKKVQGSNPVIFYRLEKTTNEAVPRIYEFRVAEVMPGAAPGTWVDWAHENYPGTHVSPAGDGNNTANPVEMKNTYRSKLIEVHGKIKWLDGNSAAHHQDITVALCHKKSDGTEDCDVGNSIPWVDGVDEQDFHWDSDDPLGPWAPYHGPKVNETDPDGKAYQYYLKHDTPAPLPTAGIDYKVESEGPGPRPDHVDPMHVHYRYVPPTIDIDATKRWNDGQLLRSAVQITLYWKRFSEPDSAAVKVPANALTGSLPGVDCKRENPLTFTPQLPLSILNPDTENLTQHWCVPETNQAGERYVYWVKEDESQLDKRFWHPSNVLGEAYTIANSFRPPLINWDDNPPDKEPNPPNPPVELDPNQDDGKMKIVKIWKNGKTARPISLNIWVYQEIEGVPGSRIPYPGPGANLVTLTPPADNGDRWEKTIEDVPDMTHKGQKYIYTVEEDEAAIPAFELVSIDNSKDEVKTVTNRFKIPTTPVDIEIIWEGGPPAKPTTQTKLTCTSNGVVVKEETTTYVHPVTTATIQVPITDDDGHPVRCKIEQPGGAPAPYVEKPTPGTTEKPIVAGGPNNLSITNRYESPHRTVIGKKTWVDGELANNGVRPTIWLKPERSLDGNTWEAVPGTAPVAVTHPDTKAVWDNVDEFDNNGVPYQFRVLEVDSAGNDWKPDNYDKIGAGTNMTNQYVIPRGDIDGRKLWGRGSDPRPTVWLKLYRQVGENPPEEVPLPEGEIKQVPSGTGTVTWQNVELTTIRGESYVFSVREVDAHGADWTAPGYYKIENGTTVTNQRLSRIYVGVSTTPLSYDVFPLVMTNGEGLGDRQSIDNNDGDATYPKELFREDLAVIPHQVRIDMLDLERWRVEGASCLMRPYDSSDPNDDVNLSVELKRDVFGRATGEFEIKPMPVEKDIRCIIQLRNLRASKIVVKNVTYPNPDIPMFPLYHYDVTGVGYGPFDLSTTSEPNVQEVAPGDFSITQTNVTGWTTIDVIATSSIIGRRPLTSLNDTGAETKAEFTAIDSEVVTLTFVNVPPNTIMLKKETIPANTGDKFRFEGILSGEISHGEYLIRTDVVPDGKQHQAIEMPHDEWSKHRVTCVERGIIGPTETRAEFYTMSAYYGLDPGETILCTFVNRKWGADDNPDIPDPDIPGFTDIGLPRTGFTPGVVTALPDQPVAKLYAPSELTLRIPKMNQTLSIVGIPKSGKNWDVTWLDPHQAGYLEESAYPTWDGNSVITAHVWDAYNNPGPFAGLKDLVYGDRFTIEAYGMTYTYEVRESERVLATAVDRVLTPKTGSWITLLTCEQYNETTDKYAYRRMVRAVLIETK